MRYPMQCKWCGHVHDGAAVQVVARYTDCSAWRCPNCAVLIDDRPEAWGGSAFPVSELRAGGSIAYAEIDGRPVCILPDGRWCQRELHHTGPHVLAPDQENAKL